MTNEGIRVLVVDDEAAIRRFLRTSLTANGYVVFEAELGAEVLADLTANRPDLVILDLGLPDMDGTEVAQQIRSRSQIPIIVLSARGQESDKIAALDAGADDYLTKPFGVGELMARLRAAMRRITPPEDDTVFELGQLRVDLTRRVVRVAGNEVQLTPTEYDLLRALVTHAGRVQTHRQLLREVWGFGYEDELHLLRVNISNLRRKLEANPARPKYIATEAGVGYRLRLEDPRPD